MLGDRLGATIKLELIGRILRMLGVRGIAEGWWRSQIFPKVSGCWRSEEVERVDLWRETVLHKRSMQYSGHAKSG